MYDAAEHELSREFGLLSDSIVESHHDVGLSATTSSSVTGGVGPDGGPEGTPSSSGVTLGLERGFVVDMCQSRSLTDGAASSLVAWVDL